MKRTLIICYMVFFIMHLVQAMPADTILITSPDRQIECKIFQQQNQFQYTVVYKNVPVVAHSSVVQMLNDKEVTGPAKSKAIKRYQIKEQYPWLGVHATAVNHCNGIKIPFQHQQTTDTLEVRVFNNGVAFRMILPAATGISR